MKVQELNRDQLCELKQNYYCDELFGNESVSYGELSEVDELVSDGEVFAFYADVEFADDDFCCSVQ